MTNQTAKYQKDAILGVLKGEITENGKPEAWRYEDRFAETQKRLVESNGHLNAHELRDIKNYVSTTLSENKYKRASTRELAQQTLQVLDQKISERIEAIDAITNYKPEEGGHWQKTDRLKHVKTLVEEGNHTTSELNKIYDALSTKHKENYFSEKDYQQLGKTLDAINIKRNSQLDAAFQTITNLADADADAKYGTIASVAAEMKAEEKEDFAETSAHFGKELAKIEREERQTNKDSQGEVDLSQYMVDAPVDLSQYGVEAPVDFSQFDPDRIPLESARDTEIAAMQLTESEELDLLTARDENGNLLTRDQFKIRKYLVQKHDEVLGDIPKETQRTPEEQEAFTREIYQAYISQPDRDSNGNRIVYQEEQTFEEQEPHALSGRQTIEGYTPQEYETVFGLEPGSLAHLGEDHLESFSDEQENTETPNSKEEAFNKQIRETHRRIENGIATTEEIQETRNYVKNGIEEGTLPRTRQAELFVRYCDRQLFVHGGGQYSAPTQTTEEESQATNWTEIEEEVTRIDATANSPQYGTTEKTANGKWSSVTPGENNPDFTGTKEGYQKATPVAAEPKQEYTPEGIGIEEMNELMLGVEQARNPEAFADQEVHQEEKPQGHSEAVQAYAFNLHRRTGRPASRKIDRRNIVQKINEEAEKQTPKQFGTNRPAQPQSVFGRAWQYAGRVAAAAAIALGLGAVAGVAYSQQGDQPDNKPAPTETAKGQEDLDKELIGVQTKAVKEKKANLYEKVVRLRAAIGAFETNEDETRIDEAGDNVANNLGNALRALASDGQTDTAKKLYENVTAYISEKGWDKTEASNQATLERIATTFQDEPVPEPVQPEVVDTPAPQPEPTPEPAQPEVVDTPAPTPAPQPEPTPVRTGSEPSGAQLETAAKHTAEVTGNLQTAGAMKPEDLIPKPIDHEDLTPKPLGGILHSEDKETIGFGIQPWHEREEYQPENLQDNSTGTYTNGEKFPELKTQDDSNVPGRESSAAEGGVGNTTSAGTAVDLGKTADETTQKLEEGQITRVKEAVDEEMESVGSIGTPADFYNNRTQNAQEAIETAVGQAATKDLRERIQKVGNEHLAGTQFAELSAQLRTNIRKGLDWYDRVGDFDVIWHEKVFQGADEYATVNIDAIHAQALEAAERMGESKPANVDEILQTKFVEHYQNVRENLWALFAADETDNESLIKEKTEPLIESTRAAYSDGIDAEKEGFEKLNPDQLFARWATTYLGEQTLDILDEFDPAEEEVEAKLPENVEDKLDDMEDTLEDLVEDSEQFEEDKDFRQRNIGNQMINEASPVHNLAQAGSSFAAIADSENPLNFLSRLYNAVGDVVGIVTNPIDALLHGIRYAAEDTPLEGPTRWLFGNLWQEYNIARDNQFENIENGEWGAVNRQLKREGVTATAGGVALQAAEGYAIHKALGDGGDGNNNNNNNNNGGLQGGRRGSPGVN